MTQLYELKTKGLEYIGTIPADHINDKKHYRKMAQTFGLYRGGKCVAVVFENYNYICYKHTYDPATNNIYYDKNDKYTCDHYFDF